MSKKKRHKATSSKVTTANQANAQQSTGPKTPEGKAASAQNSLKHGLTSKTFRLLDWEDPEEYAAFSADYFQRLAPTHAQTTALVTTIVQLRWQILRTFTLETHVMATTWDDPQLCVHILERLQRYRTSMERQLKRTTQELEALTAPPPSPTSVQLGLLKAPLATGKTVRPAFAHLPLPVVQVLDIIGKEILRQKEDNPDGGDPELIELFHAIRTGEIPADEVEAAWKETGLFCQKS